ncbi:MAG: tetratricopeptide repeat protein [Thermodesulfobacteriota bacterium]|nr:tetratricopeptide repeat protein [Thermodesulfobacteriota bacterium]
MHEKQAESYVNKVLPEIVKKWDMAKLTSYSHPEFFKITPRDSLGQLFFLFKKLGPLKEYKGSQGKVIVSKASTGLKVISGDYSAKADFENGTATITVVILKEKKRWSIIRFRVDSNSFHIPDVSEKRTGDIEIIDEKLTKDKLEKEVEEILANDIVDIRRSVDNVFRLARLYEKEGNEKKALQLYEKALQADAANLDNQLRFAKLLLKHDRKGPAIQKLRYIYELSEDWGVFQEARTLLVDMQIDLPTLQSKIECKKDIEILLIPTGNPNKQVLSELKAVLQDKMGIAVSIAERAIELGDFDRKWSDQYTSEIFTNITKELTPLQYDMLVSETGMTIERLQLPLHQHRFIIAYLEKMGKKEGELACRQFERELERLYNLGQYRVTPLVVKLRDAFPFDRSETVKSYIGVTSKDLYCENCNFLFGSTAGSYGVISYYQYTAELNREKPNRPRLVKRLLKQALSSVNSTFGIPRCNTPYCARSYPHSLAEHDAKSDDLCWECKERLDAYKKDPRSYTSAWDYDRCGRGYLDSSEWDKAIAAYKKAIKNDPNFGAAYQGLGIACQQKGQHDNAVEAYQKSLELIPGTDSIYIFLGNHYFLKKQYKIALEQFSTAQNINPENMKAHYGLGLAYKNLGQLKKAIEHFETARALSPNDARPYENLGICYNKQGKVQEAIEAYEIALKINPELYATHYNYGLLLKTRQKNKAVEHFKKAIAINPSFFEVHIALGMIYGMDGLFDDSIAMFKAALAIRPDDAEVWNDLGFTYYLKGMHRKAIEQYRRALAISPKHALAHYNKAMAHYAVKQFDIAIVHYDEAVKLKYPGSPKFRAALELYRVGR